MWIVLFALRYKYTVAVMAIAIALFGVLSARHMSTDILPRVESPEILVVWTYSGLNARELASKITSFSEIATLNNVDNVREVRSDTTNGVAIVRIKFQPDADLSYALAQVTAISQTMLRRMPPGTTPPIIVPTSPSNVPVLQLVIASDSLSDAALFDWARLALRAQIQSIPGIRLSLPYGGASRQIMVDIDPAALNALGLSAVDVGRALATQNLTLPSGNVREAGRDLPISLNASPETVDEFLSLPLRTVDGRTVLLRDVANVRDGEAVQTNIARLNGQNAVLVSILKLGNASTLTIIDEILKRLPQIRAGAPPGLTIEPIFDQSVFVRAAIDTVLKEIVIVGALVALMVLLFLGSWRSTAIVLTSIPLALLCSVIGLNLSGHTFNLMSLGGLALAIGILVDNALVEIENIKRQIGLGKDVRTAVLDGARQVAFPEFVSTTGICIVFLPIFLLSGTASYVFKPLALAVIFAMVASYILSRTLVPTLASMLLPAEVLSESRPPGPLRRIHHAIEGLLDKAALLQGRLLNMFCSRPLVVPALMLAVVAAGASAWTAAGREFFPTTDAGLMRLFLRVPAGARVEETAKVFAEIQRDIRGIIAPEDLLFIAENIGMPASVNLAWVESTATGSFDGEILIQLAAGHRPTAEYMSEIRGMIKEKFPHVQLFFRPSDATGLTLSGGAPTTFEARFIGRDVAGNTALAKDLLARLDKINGAVDVTFREVLDLPGYAVDIDRTRASSLGVSLQDAVGALLNALGSGGTVAPTFWSDPKAGTSYEVSVAVPPVDLPEASRLLDLPVRPSAGGDPVVLGAFATLREDRSPASVSRTTLLPTLTVLANVEARDLGSVLRELNPVLEQLRAEQKPGNRIELAGQAQLMASAYAELFGGLLLAAALVFLVMVVNFQSWTLPFVAISGLPAAVSGAFLGLWITGTPLSVPAWMGLIMVVGVSTANSILITSFARDLWLGGMNGRNAAIAAATTRLRPVVMTALTMILGVVPMALGLGEGGEQNAPLGRAVIGGLAFGTFASLFLVPYVFSLVRQGPARTVSASLSAPVP